MKTVKTEAKERIKAKHEAQKATRQLLVFAIASYNLNNFHVIEQVTSVYSQVQAIMGDYDGALQEEDKKLVGTYNETLNGILVNIKDISDNVLLDVKNALSLAYNEGAGVINKEENGINYTKVSSQIVASQDLLKDSVKKINDSITELGVYKERFQSETGDIAVTKITQMCEELVSVLAVNSSSNDVALSLSALETLSEMRD